jgi:hypothetical protein
MLNGRIRALLLFDISEEIDLPQLHTLLGSSPAKRAPAFRHATPEYVRYEQPPVLQTIGEYDVFDGSPVRGRIRYFSYGVASVELQAPFACAQWPDLIHLANRWILSPELEGRARTLLREALPPVRDALKKTHEDWIFEDYYVVQLEPIEQPGNTLLSAEELVRQNAAQIAQIVRGEETALSPSERQEVLTGSMSYYPTDLLVTGWVAAFVYDTQAAAAPTIDLLEYANTQLLEFRHYDEVLTQVLADVYKRLEKRRSVWAQWTLARHAQELNTIRLDYLELVERTDNAIKFLSDMFYARAYRLASMRIGVTDYRSLVTDKLTTARELYESMVNEFHQGRTFLLEVMVVIILVIEIVFLFRGKS